MVVEKNQIFNLMDTNGRRSDVLNALKVYLEILEELKEEYPTEFWDRYPNSIAQFIFYERALDKSPTVFQKHKKYDEIGRFNFIKAQIPKMSQNASPAQVSIQPSQENDQL